MPTPEQFGEIDPACTAGVLHRIVFGRNEPALHHYHQTCARTLGNPVPSGSAR